MGPFYAAATKPGPPPQPRKPDPIWLFYVMACLLVPPAIIATGIAMVWEAFRPRGKSN